MGLMTTGRAHTAQNVELPALLRANPLLKIYTVFMMSSQDYTTFDILRFIQFIVIFVVVFFLPGGNYTDIVDIINLDYFFI